MIRIENIAMHMSCDQCMHRGVITQTFVEATSEEQGCRIVERRGWVTNRYGHLRHLCPGCARPAPVSGEATEGVA